MKKNNIQKQTGGKVMKTTNNVQKANLGSTIFAVALILAGVIADGQVYSASTGMSQSDISILALSEIKTTLKTEADAGSIFAGTYETLLEEEREEAMNLEAWMTNENRFFSTVRIENEREGMLELENWMMNENNFFSALSQDTETEESLSLEDWMTNDRVFAENISPKTEKEDALALEHWMTNDQIFSKKDPSGEKETAKTEKRPVEEKAQETSGFKKKVSKEEPKSYGTVSTNKNYGRRVFIMTEMEDPKLKIETWMIDYRYWNGK